MNITTLQSCDVTNKRVLVRADLNVPLNNGAICDDFRLKAFLPTLQQLVKKQPDSIIIATHIGKPDPACPDQALSTKILIPWFVQHGITITHCTLEDIATPKQPKTVILLENLRFYPGEKSHDLAFAKQLASCADVYVNEAFATMHRNDTSITLTAQQFSPAHRCIGPLVEKEIHELDLLRNTPEPPLGIVLGGAKLDDKIPLLAHFIQHPDPARRAHIVAVGGLPALAFLKAQGHCIGATQISPTTLENARNILKLADANGTYICLPLDFCTIFDGQPLGCETYATMLERLTYQHLCVDIGRHTRTWFRDRLRACNTIFMNGTMGIFEYPAYQEGTKSVFNSILDDYDREKNPRTIIIGGGDTVAAATACGLQNEFSFVSTGGGATLAYLGSSAPENDLPGLKALLK